MTTSSLPTAAEVSARSHRRILIFALALIALRIAFPLLLIHPAWEFHRDEFLYFAMGDHLEWFHMQFPPLIGVVAHISRSVFGDHVWAARVPAAIAGASLLAVMLWLARRLGGQRWSLAMIALASIASPMYLRSSVMMQPVVFDILWATVAFSALVLAAEERQPRWWMLAGVAFGLGALTKFSVAFYVVAALAATLTTKPLREQLRSRWPWTAALLALVLAAPSIAGQVAHEWPFLQQMQSLRGEQLARVSVIEFLVDQPMMLGGAIFLLPLSISAMWHGRVGAKVAGVITIGMLLMMIALRGKGYYAAPAYPALLVTGVVWGEQQMRLRASRWRGRVTGIMLPVLMACVAMVLVPFGIPVLGPDAMARYAVAMGVSASVRTNRGDILTLPQDYADMLGWRAQAEAVSRALHALTPDERRDVLLVGSNYGEAGALAMYRERLGLPYPVSVAGDFHAWGTYGHTGEVTILVDRPDALPGLERLFEQVQEVGRIEEPRTVPEEQDVRIYLARRPRAPVDSVWRALGPRWN